VILGHIVLFPHPGSEHSVKVDGAVFPWNRKEHRRKFLVAKGHLASHSAATGWSVGKAPKLLAFWGEYEAPTTGHYFKADSHTGLPEFWHSMLPVPASPFGGQNSDPWIFGSRFRYAVCKQWIQFLRELERGDMILFGSWKEQDQEGRQTPVMNFFLDTVFFAAERYPFSVKPLKCSAPEEILDPTFLRCSLDRIKPDERMLYVGASLEDSISAFCWVPCKEVLDPEGPPRFRRPMIGDLFGKTCGNGQALMHFDGDVEGAWLKVVKRCQDLGLSLAANLANPDLEAVIGGAIDSNTAGACGDTVAEGCSPPRRGKC